MKEYLCTFRYEDILIQTILEGNEETVELELCDTIFNNPPDEDMDLDYDDIMECVSVVELEDLREGLYSY